MPKKKRYILKIIFGIIFIIFAIIGWKGYQVYSSLSNLIPSGAEFLGLFDKPVVREEYYSPDSTMKLGVYRFLVPGDGAFEISDTYISVIDTSMEYPREGNIFSVEDSIPNMEWISRDSILIQLDRPFIKKMNGITIFSYPELYE